MTDASSITGLANWWRGDDLTGGNGASISSWAARATTGGGVALVQATGANQPTVVSSIAALGGMPGALTDGVNDKLLATITSIPQPWTAFIVYSAVAHGTSTDLLGIGFNDFFLDNASGSVRKKATLGATLLSGAVEPSVGVGNLAILVANGASSGIYEGTTSLAATTGNPGTAATGTSVSIGDSTGGGIPINAHIAELGFYNVALGSTDQETLRAYVAARYFGGGGGALMPIVMHHRELIGAS